MADITKDAVLANVVRLIQRSAEAGGDEALAERKSLAKEAAAAVAAAQNLPFPSDEALSDPIDEDEFW